MSIPATLELQDDSRETRDAMFDRAFRWLVAAAGLFVLFALIGAAFSMAWGGLPAFKAFGWGFLTKQEWDVPSSLFGAAVPIFGTLVTAAIAMLIAVPVSFGIAMFLTELSPVWLRRPLGTVKTHIRNAMTKLEATTRVHAVAIALREGYISPPGSD